MQRQTIGEASARHGVPDHVLRHWEVVGALRPARTTAGHRRYGAEQDAQIELIKCGKIAGLSLAEIATVLHGEREARGPVLVGRLERLDQELQEIEASKRLLQHVLECPALDGCPECSRPHEAFRYPARSAEPSRMFPQTCA